LNLVEYGASQWAHTQRNTEVSFMQRMTALFSAALLATGLMTATAHAQEEQGAAQDPMATQQAPAQDFSDDQLQQFADASQEIAVISQEYTQRLQEAEDESAQQEVRTEANDRMIEVVEDSGLDVDTFNAIGQSIQQDPEMMQRVQEMANQS
jgi:preprotein translocase subunit SecG